jgi:hypothetical protein
MDGLLTLHICSPRLAGAQGRALRALTHPLSVALLGGLIMAPDGPLAALLAALLAAAVTWGAWAAHGQADRAAAALLGVTSRLLEAAPSRRVLHALAAAWASERDRHAQAADPQAIAAYARLGAPHIALTPRVTPTPNLARASG